MKRFILTSISIILCQLFSFAAWTYTKGELVFSNIDGGVEVSARSNNVSKSIIIPESITYEGIIYPVIRISGSAFRDCRGLTSITIPNSVKSIGVNAFYDCSSLTSVSIPNSVTSIGRGAFYGCSDLTSVSIPNSVTSIGDKAFYRCGYLTSIAIPNSVSFIGDEAFYCCGLASITIPNSVTSIGFRTFYGCAGLTSVSIPNSVTSIDAYAFYDCSRLTSITLPNSVTSIGESAFKGCSGLTSITLSNSVKSIGSNAFYNCSGLTSVTIPNSVTSIGNDAFSGCNLSLLIIGSGVKSLGTNVHGSHYTPYSVNVIWLSAINNKYYGYNNYTNKQYPYLSSMLEVDGIIYVPVNLSERTCDAIAATDKNPDLHITDKVSYKGIDMNVLKYNSDLCAENRHIKTVNIQISSDVPERAFSNCPSLEYVTITAPKISDASFEYCKSLNKIVLNETLTDIGSSAFNGCTKLIDIEFPSSLTTIGSSAFEGCYSLSNITFPSSLKSIGSGAFRKCSKLSNVIIPNNISKIGRNAFYDTSLETVTINDGSSDLILDSPFGGTKISTVYIGRNISTEGSTVFYSYLETANISDCVTMLPPGLFKNCSNLKNLTLGANIESIGEGTFTRCTGLGEITLGAKIKEIGKLAFSGCNNITKMMCCAEIPPQCNDNALSDINKLNCELSVPESAVEAYKNADQWKDFFFIKGDPNAGINNTESDRQNITVQAMCDNIIVNGVLDNILIEVFNANGLRVYCGYDTTIQVSGHGLYLVRIGNQSFKVVI